jgi:copper transport protein
MIMLIPASFTSAHSTLKDTFPKGEEELQESPKTIEIWFQDPVTIHSNSIQIFNEKGKNFETEQIKRNKKDKGHLIVTLKDPLPDGNYVVLVKVIAPDGYAISERFSFKIVEDPKEMDNLILLKGSPTDGEITKKPINKVELWFNKPVNISTIGLFDNQKNPIPFKEPVIDPQDPGHVTLVTYETLSPGTYQVSWFVRPVESKSSDSTNFVIDTMGIFYFAVEEFTPMKPIGAETDINWFSYTGLKQLAYWLSFIGLANLFGMTFFHTFIRKFDLNQKRWNLAYRSLSILTVFGIILFLVELREEVGDISLVEYFKLKFSIIPVLQIVLVAISLVFAKYRLYLYGASLFIWPFVAGHSSYPRYGGWLTLSISELHLFAA